jgi:Mycothiol maleylpyruvate isomerase N-terminal domain
MATKQEIISTLKEQGQRAERLAAQLSDEDWQRGVHEAGWNVRQAYCHVASVSGGAPIVLGMIQNAGGGNGGGGGGGFDINEFNRHQVGQRASHNTEQILEEIRTGIATSVAAVEGADESLLAREVDNPFGRPEKEAGELLNALMGGHWREHLDEISEITGKN